MEFVDLAVQLFSVIFTTNGLREPGAVGEFDETVRATKKLENQGSLNNHVRRLEMRFS